MEEVGEVKGEKINYNNIKTILEKYYCTKCKSYHVRGKIYKKHLIYKEERKIEEKSEIKILINPLKYTVLWLLLIFRRIFGKLKTLLSKKKKKKRTDVKVVENERDYVEIWQEFKELKFLVRSLIIFLVFKSLNAIAEFRVIGLDTQLLLSILFPLFLLVVEYIIYSKK